MFVPLSSSLSCTPSRCSCTSTGSPRGCTSMVRKLLTKSYNNNDDDSNNDGSNYDYNNDYNNDDKL